MYKNLTFSDLGFDGISNLATIRTDPKDGCMLPMLFSKKSKSIHEGLLTPTIMKHLQHDHIIHEDTGFIAAIAYLLDGSVQYAYNKSNDRCFRVESGRYEPERGAKEGCSGNAEFVRRKVMQMHPEGLMLYQEIPWDEENYAFRIIHDTPEDTAEGLSAEAEKIRQRNARITMGNACFAFLQGFNGREVVTEAEADEIQAALTLLDAMERHDGFIDKDDDMVKAIGDSHTKGKSGGRRAKILRFADVKKQ